MAPLRQTVYRYALPFKKGIREGFLLRLKEEKTEGWGEISPLPGFSQESLEEALEDLASKKRVLPSVQFGFHTALLDLQTPLNIPSIPIKTKIKVGDLSPEEALKTVQPIPHMRIDMNRKWSLEAALFFARHFPGVEYYEEPLLEGEDTSAFPYPVALDESLREDKLPFYPHIVAHVIKPTMHGFPLPKVQKGIDFILSSSYETELGIYQIAKLAYRLKIPLKPMGLATSHLFKETLFEETPYLKDGDLHFPKKWRLRKEKVEMILDECI